MTQLKIEDQLEELNALVIEGRLMDAFEKFYHEDVLMQENNLPPTLSKKENREREINFLNNIIEFRSAAVQNMGSAGNLSFVTWHYDYTHREWGIRNYTQTSIQQWQEGKIIKELFIYDN